MENVFFIRHKDDKENEGRAESLFKDKRIAIFYYNLKWDDLYDIERECIRDEAFIELKETDNKVTDKDLRNYKQALRKIIKIYKEGGYVFAEYSDCHLGKGNSKKGCLLLKIQKGTKPERFDTTNITMEFSEYREIEYSQYPVLLAIRPPYTTICEPKRTFKEVAQLCFGEKTYDEILFSKKSDLMHPKMVEQMCVEFLRLYGLSGTRSKDAVKLAYCTLRPGKNLAVVDIVGKMTNKYDVFAQVKNCHLKDTEVIQSFLNFSHGNKEYLIIFHKSKEQPLKMITHNGKLIWFNINQIFQLILKDCPSMIHNMIGIKTEDKETEFTKVA